MLLALQILCPVLTIIALWRMAHQDRRCFYVFWAVNACLVTIYVHSGLYVLIAEQAVYATANGYAYYRWGLRDREDRS